MLNLVDLYRIAGKKIITAVIALVILCCPLTVFAAGNLNNFVTTSNLNLRAEPNTESAVQKVLPMGTTVEIIEYISIEWFKVSVDGMTGYMNAEYLITADQYEKMQEQARIQRENMMGENITGENITGDVELVRWSEAKQVFETGVPALVLDVRTGRTYMVKSFSNGNHADVEPITPEDTAAMLATYNGKWSWDCRPIVVSINGRVMAASISGMPHGGGVNNSNNMNGQVCIHFQGSTTHNGNTSHERDHQARVLEAHRAATDMR